MTTLNDVKNKLTDIISIFKKHEVTNVRLFKGFGGIDEQYFNLLVKDCTKDKLNFSNIYELQNELAKLLNCGVSVLEESEVKNDFLLGINQSNGSVKLLFENEEASIENLSLRLDYYFGATWNFIGKQKSIDEEFLEEQKKNFSYLDSSTTNFFSPADSKKPNKSIPLQENVHEKINSVMENLTSTQLKIFMEEIDVVCKKHTNLNVDTNLKAVN